MTYAEICEILYRAGIQSPEDDTALLLQHFCGVSPARLPLERGRDYHSPDLAAAVGRRARRYPLQYILGEWGFYTGSFKVAEGVLIPRQDTELLVELGTALLPRGGRFVDLGCGSGCISVSLLTARPDARGVAVDISPVARELTAYNAQANGVSHRLCVAEGDMLSGELWSDLEGGFDLLVSNPPYIPAADVDTLSPELAHEPRLALDGGADGLDFYRALIAGGAGILNSGGRMLFECGVGQTADIIALAESRGYAAEAKYDIEGRDRAVIVSIDG